MVPHAYVTSYASTELGRYAWNGTVTRCPFPQHSDAVAGIRARDVATVRPRFYCWHAGCFSCEARTMDGQHTRLSGLDQSFLHF